MAGVLLSEMREVTREFVKNGGFESDIIVTDKNGTVETIKGIATLHSIMFSPETGLPVTARNAHITIGNDFETINVFNDSKNPTTPNFKGFRFSFIDAFGNSWSFKTEDPKTTYTFGVFTIQLGEVKNA